VIFIDTGAFVARYRVSDDWHEQAVGGWRELDKSPQRIFTSDLIVAESLKLIHQYAGAGWAARVGRQFILSSELQILRPGQPEELQAINLIEKFADQGIGFVDCVSFVLMRQRRLTSIFGFDRHFEIAGFKLWPMETR
jgi:predicted nucleic acid-binding protein